MSPLIFYVFFVLLNGEGMQGVAFTTNEDCNIARTELLALPTVLGITACTPMTLTPVQRERT